MLETYPDMTLGIIDRILALRADIKGKESAKLLRACKEHVDSCAAGMATVQDSLPGPYIVVAKEAKVRAALATSSELVTMLAKGDEVRGAARTTCVHNMLCMAAPAVWD